MAPLFHLPGRPSQPTIARLEMIGRRTEHDQRHPLASVFDDIPEHSAYNGRVLEVMFFGQVSIEARQVRLTRQPDGEFIQQPGLFW
jgi:hypothetical protein